jgi:hypothetical protein
MNMVAMALACFSWHYAGSHHRTQAEKGTVVEAGDQARGRAGCVARRQGREQVAEGEDGHQRDQCTALAEAAEQQGHDRGAQHHANGIGRHQHAGAGDADVHAFGNHRQQAHGGELGCADAEGADGQGGQDVRVSLRGLLCGELNRRALHPVAGERWQ